MRDALAQQRQDHPDAWVVFDCQDSGIDAAYIWRVLNSEKREVSREVLILLNVALVADERRVETLVEVANDLLDAAGYKSLRGK